MRYLALITTFLTLNLSTPVWASSLQDAVDSGKPEQIIDVVRNQNPGDYNVSWKNGEKTVSGSLLHYASQKGLIEVIKLLLDKGVQVDEKDLLGITALLRAVGSDQLESAELLLDHGANPNNLSAYSYGPLLAAIQDSSIEMVHLLLKRGADPNIRSSEGENALLLAANNNKFDLVKEFLEMGMDPHVRDNENRTLLMWSAAWGDFETLDTLIKKKVDPNIQTIYGSTALIGAVEENRLDIVDYLLAHGAAPNLVTQANDTAFSLAWNRRNLRVMQSLLQSEYFDLHSKKYQATYKDIFKSGQKEFILELLKYHHFSNLEIGWVKLPIFLIGFPEADLYFESMMQQGADFQSLNIDGSSVLMHAAICRKPELTRLLIEKYHLDPNHQNETGDTSLHYAGHKGYGEDNDLPEMYRTLLELGADPNIRNRSGETVLDQAIQSQQIEWVETLLEYKEKFNQDTLDCSAISKAVQLGDLQIVQMLLKAEANLNSPNCKQNLLLLAAEKGHLELVKMFLEDVQLSQQDVIQLHYQLLKIAINFQKDELVQYLLLNEALSLDDSQEQSLMDLIFQKKRLDILNWLFKQSQQTPHIHDLLTQTWLNAAKYGQKQVIEEFLKHGFDINYCDQDGKTALIYAAEHSQFVLVDELLAKGALAQIKTSDGQKAFLKALQESDPLKFSKLVRHYISYIDLKDPSISHMILLSHADFWEQGFVRNLLTQGLPLRDLLKSSDLSFELVRSAIQRKDLDLLKLLKHYGIDLEFKQKISSNYLIDYPQSALLEMALKSGFSKGLPILLETVEPNLQIQGFPLIVWLLQYPKEDLVLPLLEKGAKPQLNLKTGQTLLMFAIMYNKDYVNQRVINYLIEHKIDLDKQDENNMSAFHYAVITQQDEILSQLIAAGANTNLSNLEGNTPLLLALNENNLKAVDLLLPLQSDLNQMNKEQETLLKLAVQTRNVNLVKKFLNLKVDANIKDKFGNSPLQLALQNGDWEIAFYLFIYGAML